MDKTIRQVLHEQCTGCGACYNKCPVNAITMEYDEEGFLFPKITDACINCGQCVAACPVGALYEQDDTAKVFAALADPDTLQILLYLYTRLNTPIAASLISQNTGFSIQKVDSHMEVLCQAGCAKRTAIATSEGDIYSYMFTQEAAVVALLCLADEVRQGEEHYIAWDVNRQTPIMQSTGG